MTVTPEELENKIAQLAGRFLDRVVKEVQQLRSMVEAAASGDQNVVREIETLAHRMHGSGAMLRFHEISAQAGELESMAAGFLSAGVVDQPRMLPVLAQLEATIAKACEARKHTAS